MAPLEPDDFARLLRLHLPRATRLAVRLCGDVHAAEDVVGEALLRATRHFRSFRGESAFATWLHRIVINCFRDSLRRDRRPPMASEQALADVATPMTPAPERMAADELGREVARLVSALPPRQREALVLTVYEGHTAEQAAELMETTAQNVRVLSHHARTRLKQQLQIVEANHA